MLVSDVFTAFYPMVFNRGCGGGGVRALLSPGFLPAFSRLSPGFVPGLRYAFLRSSSVAPGFSPGVSFGGTVALCFAPGLSPGLVY